MSEELKGQLGERFPAAIALFAKSQKMTIPELFKAMEKGLVKSDALEAFGATLAIEARKGGALDVAKNSTAAQQQRMGNAFNDSIENFSAGGFDAASARFFKTVADSVSKVQPLIKSLGGAFEILSAPINAVVKLLGQLGELWPKIAEGMGLTNRQFSTLAIAAGIFLLPLGSAVTMLGVLALALEDLTAYSKGNKSFFGEWVKEHPAAQKAVDSIMQSWDHFKSAGNDVLDVLTKIGEKLGIIDTQTKGIDFNATFISSLNKLASLLETLAHGLDAIARLGELDLKGFGNSLGRMKDEMDNYINQNLTDAAGYILKRTAGRMVREREPTGTQNMPANETPPIPKENNIPLMPSKIEIHVNGVKDPKEVADMVLDKVSSLIGASKQKEYQTANSNLVEVK